MAKYVVARSMSETYLAVRYAERPVGEVEEGEVIGEFRDKKIAKDFCQTWYGLTKKKAAAKP